MSTLALITEHVAATSHLVAAGTIPNPLENVFPDFSVFGTQFNQLWQKVLAGLWGLALIAAIAGMLIGGGRMAVNGGANGNPQAYKDARSGLGIAAIGFGVLAAIAIIVGAILFFVSLG